MQKLVIEKNHTINLSVVRSGFSPEDNYCWITHTATPMESTGGKILVSMKKCELHTMGRTDIFGPPCSMFSNNGGLNWSQHPNPDCGLEDHYDGDWKYVYNGNPKLHYKSGQVLTIGNWTQYFKNNLANYSSGSNNLTYKKLVYSTLQDDNRTWENLVNLDGIDFPHLAYNGGMQRIELADGDILLPIYAKMSPNDKMFSIVFRCSFDGVTLKVKDIGNKLCCNIKRGFTEPSLTFFEGKYFVTIRNDLHGYVAISTDGINYCKPVKWTFDDGSDLGSYNTQQHWVKHGEKLYLVYTRRGANNEHMALFRHRAPLFMAEVDSENLCVIRDSEEIIVPDRGAKIGNFDVVDINEYETWVIVAEWMEQRNGLVSTDYGSDNSVFIAKIKWQNN